MVVKLKREFDNRSLYLCIFAHERVRQKTVYCFAGYKITSNNSNTLLMNENLERHYTVHENNI